MSEKKNFDKSKNPNYEFTKEQEQKQVQKYVKDNCYPEIMSEAPVIEVVTGGVGAGKTSIEILKAGEIKKAQGITPVKFNEDYLATYHPYAYDLIDELPDYYFRKSREFVRPVFQQVCDELIKHRVNVVNENVLDGPARDLNMFRAFKKGGYQVHINFMATDWLESRLSACQRAAKQVVNFTNGISNEKPRGCDSTNQKNMYNTCISGTELLDLEGLVDDVSIYIRPDVEGKKPILVYSRTQDAGFGYSNYKEAVLAEREKQRLTHMINPHKYLKRLKWSKKIFEDYKKTNEELGISLSDQCDEVEKEFMEEYLNHLGTYIFKRKYSGEYSVQEEKEAELARKTEAEDYFKNPHRYLARIKAAHLIVLKEEQKGILPKGSVMRVREFSNGLKKELFEYASNRVLEAKTAPQNHFAVEER